LPPAACAAYPHFVRRRLAATAELPHCRACGNTRAAGRHYFVMAAGRLWRPGRGVAGVAAN